MGELYSNVGNNAVAFIKIIFGSLWLSFQGVLLDNIVCKDRETGAHRMKKTQGYPQAILYSW